MISTNLPALQVVLPMLGAPVCALIARGRAAWALALIVAVACTAVAGALLAATWNGTVLSYAMGGWEPPWGIEYRVDVLNAFVLLLVSAMALATLVFARDSVEQEIDARLHGKFYSAFLLCMTGLLGITITGDAFNAFVFLEISSLATYALISLGRDRRALTASFQYLIMGTVGATFFLIGVGLLYAMTGSLNMADLSVRLGASEETRTIRTALAFITVGLSLKLALFPLHLWLPNAYAFAPSVVSAFLAATATKVAVYLLVRFLFTVFGSDFAFGGMALQYVLVPLALAGVFTTSVVAIFQTDIKRMLAYSSVAQLGYMILGIGIASATGLTAAVLHLFNHALMKGALFLALGAVCYRIGSVTLDGMAGIGRRMPLTMAGFVVGGLSLIGVPLTAGFISKWYLILGALERGWWWLAVLLVISSLLAVIYIWRVVEVAYFRDPGAGDAGAVREAPVSLLAPLWLLALANLYFGVDTSLTVGAAGRAAAMMMGLQP